MNKLHLLIQELPDETDDIAAYLKLQGIKGIANNKKKCVISNYLLANGAEYVETGYSEICARIGNENFRIMTPEKILEFINKFDAHVYYSTLEYESPAIQ